MLISVIVTTYNRPKALELVLEALNQQSDMNFEVIVADDGSSIETQNLLSRLQKVLNFSLRHIWQEDKGFRAARARNLAVLESRGDYLLFLDGDSVPCSNFIKNHKKLAEAGWMVAGNRVLLSETFTKQVESFKIEIYRYTWFKWFVCFLTGQVNRIVPFWDFSSFSYGRKSDALSWKKVRSCNLGIWRKDFFAVNGFDCQFEGWGFEDSDLAIRLLNSGIRKKNGSFATGIIHLWHKEFDRSNEEKNFKSIKDLLITKRTRSRFGLDELGTKGGGETISL